MKRHAKLGTIICLVIMLMIPSWLYSGTYVRDCGEEILTATLVEDFRYPFFQQGIYITFLYSSYENGAPFYTGLVMKGSSERNIFNNAFWKGGMDGKVEPLFTGPTIFPSSTGGEAATGGASGRIPFIKAQQWNKIVYKIWQPESDPESTSYFGLWVKDIEANRWYHIGTFRLPVHSRGIKGLGGFFEEITMNKQLHEVHRRRSYALDPEGKWHSLSKLKVRSSAPGKTPWYWYISDLPDEEGQVVRFAHDEKLLPDHNIPRDGKYHAYTLTQPEIPTFQAFTIENAQVQKVGDQLLVSWSLPKGCPPHIGGYIEISDRSAPKKVLETHPAETTYQDSLTAVTKVKNPVVRLVLRSVFDQHANCDDVLMKQVSPKPADRYQGDVASGLQYEYYEPKADIDVLATAFTGPRKNFGVAKNLDLSIKPQEIGKSIPFALKFDGFLDVPQSGFYQFHVKATDGYQLSVGNQTLIYDKPHGPTPRILNVYLEKGLNTFHLDYFNARHGEEWLDVSWTGPQMPLQPIADKYFFQPQVNTPVYALKLTSEKGSQLKASVESTVPTAPAISSVEYYAGKRLWAKAEQGPFAVTCDAVGGKQNYWARVYFSDNSTVTTSKVAYEHQNVFEADETWEYIGYSHNKSPVSYTFDGQNLSMNGLGKHGIMKNIQGDFTLKVRVDELAGGLKNSYVSLALHGRTFGIYHLNTGLCLPTHQRDFAGGTFGNRIITDQDEPKDVQWLCLTRKGKHFFTYYSHDGRKWHKANEIFTAGFSKGCKAGIVFETHLKIGAPYFSVKLDNISFAPHFDDTLMPQAEVIDITLKPETVTGFIYAQSKENPNKAYARTLNGLLVTEDFGKTWKRHHGLSAEKADGMIRSLAVNPANPEVLYCAEVEDGTSKLLLSRDAGKHWQSIRCPVSFTNIAKNHLMGEILAIDDDNPERVLVAGTTGGVHLSVDEGATWKLIGHKGQYVSFVQFNQKLNPQISDSRLYIGVIPEQSALSWLSNPQNNAQYLSSVSIRDLESGKNRLITAPAPVIDIRFQSMGDKYKWFYITTMRGVYETVNGGHLFLQMFNPNDYAQRKVSETCFDQPVTAFDMSYQNERQNMMYAFRPQNPDVKNPQAFYMKKPFKVNMPALGENERILKILCHPADTEKAMLSTDEGLLYSTTGTRFESHVFKRANL